MKDGFIPKHGGYENLLSYRKAVIIYQGTVCFCRRFLNPRDRTVDQMVQAARSGKQNIVEGSMASGTSKETELKLTNVARASLEELLEDYKDYLLVNSHEIWDKESEKALFVRKLGRKPGEAYEAYKEFLETRPPDVCANIMICLIHQCTYLLNQQIHHLEREFISEGGLRERMYTARVDFRRKNR